MIVAQAEKLAIAGGTPVRDIKSKPWSQWPVFDETEERAVLEVLRSGIWWSGYGTQGKEFEKEFAEFQNAKYGVNCTNGTAALVISLRALGIGCGDEVIVPPYTFVATASSVLEVGGIPVFVDIEDDTLNLDPTLIEAAITPRTKAVIPAHIAGRPADMDAIMAVAKKHNLFVIEDAAQAHASEWRGTKVGAIGHLGTFSFQASKNLTAGEGGIILSNDHSLIEACWSVANVGRSRGGHWYEHHVLGSNFRLGEFQTALLRTQLKRVPEQTLLRTKNALYLREMLTHIPGIILPSLDPRITCHSYHLFTLRYQKEEFGGRSPSDFLEALEAEGVTCSYGYIPLYKEDVFNRKKNCNEPWCAAGRPIDYPNLDLPVCEAVSQNSVWLDQPILLGDDRDMEDIAEAISKIHRAWA